MTDHPSTPSDRRWKVDVCGQSDLGRQRTNNEDNFLVVDLDRASTTIEPTSRIQDVGTKGTVLIVADGMGGANAGEVASQMAVEIISRQMSDLWSAGNGQVPDQFLPSLVEAVKTSNREIKARGMEDDTKRGMGSTCVVAGVLNGRALLCNVGDSRGYLLRGTEAKQLTHDQSFVQHLLDVGAITKEQAVRSPRRNVVMEALGAREEVNVAQVAPLDLEHGDILVLCSDGLTGHVEDEEIIRVAYSTNDQAERCRRLIELANERGGKDNITVIVAECLIEGQPALVRPVLPPIEPKPPEPPPDPPSAEPAPMPIAMVSEEPLEPDPDLNAPGREYSLATGFILGLSVGLVASVIFLGEHLRSQRDELQASYRHELSQKEASNTDLRMQVESRQKALDAAQRDRDGLERDLVKHLNDWQNWAFRAKEKNPRLPRLPEEPASIAEIMNAAQPDNSASPEAPAPESPAPVASPEPETITIPTMSPGPAPLPSATPSAPAPVASVVAPPPPVAASPSPIALPSPSPVATPSPVAVRAPVTPARVESPSPAAPPSPVASPSPEPSPVPTPATSPSPGPSPAALPSPSPDANEEAKRKAAATAHELEEKLKVEAARMLREKQAEEKQAAEEKKAADEKKAAKEAAQLKKEADKAEKAAKEAAAKKKEAEQPAKEQDTDGDKKPDTSHPSSAAPAPASAEDGEIDIPGMGPKRLWGDKKPGASPSPK